MSICCLYGHQQTHQAYLLSISMQIRFCCAVATFRSVHNVNFYAGPAGGEGWGAAGRADTGAGVSQGRIPRAHRAYGGPARLGQTDAAARSQGQAGSRFARSSPYRA